jgi:hypothetical protein
VIAFINWLLSTGYGVGAVFRMYGAELRETGDGGEVHHL